MKIGQLCTKINGREAKHKCLVVDIIDDNFVLIDGNVKRRKCNIKHLEPSSKILSIEKGVSTLKVKEIMEKEGINIKERKPKEVVEKKEKPVKKRKEKIKEEKKENESKGRNPKKISGDSTVERTS